MVNYSKFLGLPVFIIAMKKEILIYIIKLFYNRWRLNVKRKKTGKAPKQERGTHRIPLSFIS
jgi:hypothetical protein